jgi:hypothetical protein
VGFDCTWVELPTEIDVFLDEHVRGKAWNELVSAKLTALHEKYGSSFEVSIWGMGFLRTEMAKRGMLRLLETPPAELENVPDEVPRLPNGYVDGLSKEYERFERQICEDDERIPLYKLLTNDMYRVFPFEITGSLRAGACVPEAIPNGYRDTLVEGFARTFSQAGLLVQAPVYAEEELNALWGRWISFLESAREHGGFIIW